MQALELPEVGRIDRLAVADRPRPDPDADELLVRVHAAGVNPLDWLVCRGQLPELRGDSLPWIPGWDLAGTVEVVGEGVSAFDPGDAVWGMLRRQGTGGTYAEYVTVGADAVAEKPASLSPAEAASLPMASQTALHALSTIGDVGPDDRVLVHAAAGGVGHLAVQLAANAGAHVIGTASGANESYLRDLGVDRFVDYTETRFEDELASVDFVLDAVGGDVLDRSVRITAPGGVVVTLPEPPDADDVERFETEHDVAVRFFDVILDSDPDALGVVRDRADAGVLAPTVSDSFPLAEATTALRRSADGHVRGKLVLDVVDETD